MVNSLKRKNDFSRGIQRARRSARDEHASSINGMIRLSAVPARDAGKRLEGRRLLLMTIHVVGYAARAAMSRHGQIGAVSECDRRRHIVVSRGLA
ncbi:MULTISPECIES: hypothetical protein [Lysobacter]|uniref:hypothetical protein n=1 Tax=Lysobacter TaxID=68 RepID=UPI001F3E192F|nr:MULTISPECIES: hypothetical protein [Lysobacter]UJB18107.1 hypothetical protein L1A79_17365 [Lysobacter capsici]UJQ28170.1 hypothetical protein L2D09_22520 [Lysobacter gummosus]